MKTHGVPALPNRAAAAAAQGSQGVCESRAPGQHAQPLRLPPDLETRNWTKTFSQSASSSRQHSARWPVVRKWLAIPRSTKLRVLHGMMPSGRGTQESPWNCGRRPPAQCARRCARSSVRSLLHLQSCVITLRVQARPWSDGRCGPAEHALQQALRCYRARILLNARQLH